MTLSSVPFTELERIRALDVEPTRARRRLRRRLPDQHADDDRARRLGHVGTSFSAMDVVSWLQLEVLGEGGRYFSSKGHDAPGLTRS